MNFYRTRTQLYNGAPPFDLWATRGPQVVGPPPKLTHKTLLLNAHTGNTKPCLMLLLLLILSDEKPGSLGYATNNTKLAARGTKHR